jgi:hypothetical protein
MIHLRLSALVVAAALAVASSAHAAPIPFTSELPITGDDIRALRGLLPPEEVVPALDFLATVRVFEDDASAPERTILYLAPFYTADTTQEVIGGQQIACWRTSTGSTRCSPRSRAATGGATGSRRSAPTTRRSPLASGSARSPTRRSTRCSGTRATTRTPARSPSSRGGSPTR